MSSGSGSTRKENRVVEYAIVAAIGAAFWGGRVVRVCRRVRR